MNFKTNLERETFWKPYKIYSKKLCNYNFHNILNMRTIYENDSKKLIQYNKINGFLDL